MLFMSCACHAFAFVHSALWSPVGKWLISWLSFVMFNCVCVTFPCVIPCGILGQVWYMTVSFPERCLLSYLSQDYLTSLHANKSKV